MRSLAHRPDFELSARRPREPGRQENLRRSTNQVRPGDTALLRRFVEREKPVQCILAPTTGRRNTGKNERRKTNSLLSSLSQRTSWCPTICTMPRNKKLAPRAVRFANLSIRVPQKSPRYSAGTRVLRYAPILETVPVGRSGNLKRKRSGMRLDKGESADAG